MSTKPLVPEAEKPARKGKSKQKKVDLDNKEVDPMLEKVPKYERGQANTGKNVRDKKLKGNMKKTEERFKDAAYKAACSELLLTEEAGVLEAEGMERTYKFTQRLLADNVDVSSARKIFKLNLDTFGPYNLDYTRNGRNMLISGRKGHVATFDWKEGKLGCEIQLKETVRDAKWLHNETMFAVAQKKYVYIYDHTGMEIHCLRKHIEVNRLEFLPYHFLLASVGNAGYLKYQDTSTGQLVAEHRTKLGRCDVMTQNPQNAIIHLGHSNGTVTLWSPTVSTPLVKMLCHRGPVQAVAVDMSGKYMVTSGLDGELKVWDVRTYQELQNYYTPTPASSLSISQRGLLAVAYGPNIGIWKDVFNSRQQSPYMNHLEAGTRIQDIHFCPFDDVLGVGHSEGISSLIIPGSGEPNFDALEANPYQTKKQRQESEVKSLLDKIQPDMITLNPDFVATINNDAKAIVAEERRQKEVELQKKITDPKFRMRGKNSSSRRFLRKKQKNVIDAKKVAARETYDMEKAQRAKRARGEPEGNEPSTALDRFSKRTRT